MAIEQKDIRKFRRDLDINQEKLWGRIAVSLSYGCVLEKCNKVIPPRILLLFNLAWSDTPIKYLAELRETTVEQLIKDGK